MLDGRLLARALGLFSLGLGLVQLVAPRRFAKWIGIRPKEEREAGVRAVGWRELVAAVGLLARPLPVAFMWLRVIGDVMDMALLRRAMRARDTRTERTGPALLAVAGVTALDLVGSVQLTRQAAARTNGRRVETGEAGGRRHVRKSVTIARPREDVYAFWRDFGNLPRFMLHLEAVRVTDERRSHWIAKAPFGAKVEWDAEIVEDVPSERIAWRSVEGSQVSNEGVVTFETAPAGRGTIVTADFVYDPPGGPLGVTLARLTGEEPEQQVADDLRRFKQLMETGEVVVSEAIYGGRKVRQRPAQPVPAGA